MEYDLESHIVINILNVKNYFQLIKNTLYFQIF